MGVRNKIVPLRQHNGVEPEFHTTEDYVRLMGARSVTRTRSARLVANIDVAGGQSADA